MDLLREKPSFVSIVAKPALWGGLHEKKWRTKCKYYGWCYACQKAAWAVKQFMYCHGINNAFCCLHCSWNELSLMRHLCWHRVSQMMYKYPSNEGTHSVVRQKWIQAHFDCSDWSTRDFLHFMITQIWCLLVTKSLISWMQYKPLF